ncbi:MAG: hypothetical protein HQ530_04930 [Parcubacteria group bacterium]|nr:hypothetical protein [Parcubacteria group bacterium]
MDRLEYQYFQTERENERNNLSQREQEYQESVGRIYEIVGQIDPSDIKIKGTSAESISLVNGNRDDVKQYGSSQSRALRCPQRIKIDVPIEPNNQLSENHPQNAGVLLSAVEFRQLTSACQKGDDAMYAQTAIDIREVIAREYDRARKWDDEALIADTDITISSSAIAGMIDALREVWEHLKEEKTPGNFLDERYDVLVADISRQLKRVSALLAEKGIALQFNDFLRADRDGRKAPEQEEQERTLDLMTKIRREIPDELEISIESKSFTLSCWEYMGLESGKGMYLNTLFDGLWESFCRQTITEGDLEESSPQVNTIAKEYKREYLRTINKFQSYLTEKMQSEMKSSLTKMDIPTINKQEAKIIFDILFKLWQAETQTNLIYCQSENKERPKLEDERVLVHYAYHEVVQPGNAVDFFGEKSEMTNWKTEKMEKLAEDLPDVEQRAQAEKLLAERRRSFFLTREKGLKNRGFVTFNIEQLLENGFIVIEADNSAADEGDLEKYLASKKPVGGIDDFLKYQSELYENYEGGTSTEIYQPYCPEYLILPPSRDSLKQMVEQKLSELKAATDNFLQIDPNFTHDRSDRDKLADPNAQKIDLDQLDLNKEDHYRILVNVLFNNSIIEASSAPKSQISGFSI